LRRQLKAVFFLFPSTSTADMNALVDQAMS
jgi:hypothetical protein